MHVKASAKPVQDPDIISGGDLLHWRRRLSELEEKQFLATQTIMGKKKHGKTYATAAAGATRPTAPVAAASVAPSDPGAPPTSAPPSTPPPAQKQSRGTPATRTTATRPDPSKAKNNFDAIAEDDEPSGESGESEAGEGEDDKEDGRYDEEEEAEEGEVQTTTPTPAPNPVNTNPTGPEGAWLWRHLLQHAEAGTNPKKWVLNLAMGQVGGIPADYTQVNPRSLLSDLTLEQQLSPESRENCNTPSDANPALSASNLTTTSSPTAATQGTTSSTITVTEAATNGSNATQALLRIAQLLL